METENYTENAEQSQPTVQSSDLALDLSALNQTIAEQLSQALVDLVGVLSTENHRTY